MVSCACPADEQLWPVVVGETPEEALERHLNQCDECRRRVAEDRMSLSLLRNTLNSPGLNEPSFIDRPSLSDLLIRFSGNDVRSDDDVPESLDDQQAVEGDGDDLSSLLSGCPKLGKYQIVRRLSAGGQGVVLHAWHTTLNREVAIKVCRQAVDASRSSRIVSEGTLLARINHPGLAQVYDLDVYEGHPYLVMEYVSGRNLRQLMQMSALSIRTRIRIMHELATAVAEAHRHGILHLDLKPENVMIDEQHHVKLIDFGMGCLLPDAESRDRLVAGTYEYMAPEQMRGHMANWTSRTDVYGLGAVLYFLLTGGPPVDTRRLQTAKDHDEAIRTAIRSLDGVRGIGNLKDVCAKALAPEPTRRYRDARSFDTAMQRAIRIPWLAVSLIVIGACAMLSAVLTVKMGRPFFSPHVPPAATGQAATRWSGVRLTVQARCPRSSNLSLYLRVPQHGIMPFKGLATTAESGYKVYQLPTTQDTMAFYGADWVLVLAVEDSGDHRDLAKELVLVSEQAAKSLAVPPTRTNFGTGRWNDRQPVGNQEDLVSWLQGRLEDTKIDAQGVYLRSSDEVPGQEPNVSIVQLHFL